MKLRAFRAALESVPAKPVLSICLTATAIAGAWHLVVLRGDCLERGGRSARLQVWAETLAAGGADASLASAFDEVEWDNVLIRTDPRDDSSRVPGCPLGWHWTRAQRDDLHARGALSLFLFVREGAPVALVEYRADEVRFSVSGEEVIPRETARFRLKEETERFRAVLELESTP